MTVEEVGSVTSVAEKMAKEIQEARNVSGLLKVEKVGKSMLFLSLHKGTQPQ